MWTEFFVASTAIAFSLSLAAVFVSVRTVARVRALQDRLVSLPISSTGSLSKRVDSLDTKLEETVVTLGELAQKVKMMKVRNAVHHMREESDGDKLPDPYREPDRWRDAVNSRIARSKIGP